MGGDWDGLHRSLEPPLPTESPQPSPSVAMPRGTACHCSSLCPARSAVTPVPPGDSHPSHSELSLYADNMVEIPPCAAFHRVFVQHGDVMVSFTPCASLHPELAKGGVTARGPQRTIANFGVISLGPFLRDQLWGHFFGANIKGYFSLFLLSAQCSVSLNPIKSTPFGELTTLQVWLKKKKVMNLQTPLLSPNPPINLAMLSRTWGLPVPGLC